VELVFSSLQETPSSADLEHTTNGTAELNIGATCTVDTKAGYCDVTLLEDSTCTIQDTNVLNIHGIEYSTITGTKNEHVSLAGNIPLL
jgi:hypothetical protein